MTALEDCWKLLEQKTCIDLRATPGERSGSETEYSHWLRQRELHSRWPRVTTINGRPTYSILAWGSEELEPPDWVHEISAATTSLQPCEPKSPIFWSHSSCFDSPRVTPQRRCRFFYCWCTSFQPSNANSAIILRHQWTLSAADVKIPSKLGGTFLKRHISSLHSTGVGQPQNNFSNKLTDQKASCQGWRTLQLF
jgi:hypothetical protein